MKTLQLLSVAALLIFLLSCQATNKTVQQEQQIPELRMRPHLIGPEEEMGYIRDTYQSLVTKMKTNPADHESMLSLAELFMQEARISGEHGYYYPAALQIINMALNGPIEDGLKYRALLDKAAVLLSLHQFPEAKEYGEQALKLNAYSADAYGVLVDAFVELGDYDNAVKMADKMVSIRPDLRSYSRVSYLREIYGDVNGSIEAMKMAVSAGYPGMEQTEWARLTLGYLYDQYGHPDSAMLQYASSLSARPNYPFAIAAMANGYASMGNTRMADSLNAVASNLIPEVGFFMDKAMWEKEKGNLETANAIAKEVLAMMADDEKAGHSMSLELARVYLLLMNDPATALDYAMKEYAIRPENIEVNKVLAEIYFHQNDLVKSYDHLMKALKTGSVDPATKCLEGILMTRTNQQAAGERLLKQVFIDNPNLDCSYCQEARSIII